MLLYKIIQFFFIQNIFLILSKINEIFHVIKLSGPPRIYPRLSIGIEINQ